MIKRYILIILIIIGVLVNLMPIYSYAAGKIVNQADSEWYVGKSISYLSMKQNDEGFWYSANKNETSRISDTYKYLESIGRQSSLIIQDLNKTELFFEYEEIKNNEDVANYLIALQPDDEYFCSWLALLQNKDGGFGLSDGYASDITKEKKIICMIF